MSEVLEFSDPGSYSKDLPIHMAVYAKNGIGKTTFAGNAAKDGMNVTLIDCSDSGAVTLRNHPKDKLRIIRASKITRYLDIVEQVTREQDKVDLLVVDTLTGLQSLALREVKGKRSFEMNQRKWGLVAARVIECIAETRNFPKDVLYLVQEKKSSGEDEADDSISTAVTPSVRNYLSSAVDWVGHLILEDQENEKTGGVDQIRFLDFRITQFVEAKDRAGIFPKRIKNPAYHAIRKKIAERLNEITTNQGETNA